MSENVTIPGYTIERKLDQGGMATVYFGHFDIDKNKVAIKVMSPYLAADPSFCERFLRECYLTKQLTHPNILSISAYGETQGVYYMVMEYLPGGTLADRIKNKSLTAEQSLEILAQVTKALSYAHSKQIIHRDVKPSNVMFRSENDAVLTDFGISKAIISATEITIEAKAIGSPTYMSPEQTISKNIDTRTDIYSLGIMFYEMLAGTVPYDADNPVAIAVMHQKEPIPRLPATLAQYQPLLDRMMAKSADDRFQTAEELLISINEFLMPADMKRTVIRELNIAEPDREKAADVKTDENSESKSNESKQSTINLTPNASAATNLDSALKKESETRMPWRIISAIALAASVAAAAVVLMLPKDTPIPAEPMPKDTTPNAPKPPPTLPAIKQPVAENPPVNAINVKPDTVAPPATPPDVAVTGPAARTVTVGSSPGEIAAAIDLCKKYSDNCKPSAYADEQLKQVTLNPYVVDTTEVTNAEFEKFANATSYTTTAENDGFAFLYQPTFGMLAKVKDLSWRNPEGPDSNYFARMNHPVIFVSLEDAKQYCQWANGRLPTEAEWEYAAKGDNRNIFPWGNNWDETKAHWQTGDINGTTDVKSLPEGTTLSGLYGLAGNVWEWTSSVDGNNRSILKGGSWADSNPASLRASARRIEAPTMASSEIGFRCVKDATTWPTGD